MRVLVHTLLIVLFCFTNAAWAQSTPRDVQLLTKAEEILLSSPSESAAIDALVPLLMDNCEQIAKESGSPRLFDLDDESFQNGLKKVLRSGVKKYLLASRSTKAAARVDLLRMATNRKNAEAILAKWLDVKNVPAAKFGSIKAQGELPISSQLKARTNGVGLSLNAEGTVLHTDTGGPGAGNGTIDGGEWVDLEISLKNTTGQPWFSTSAWAKRNHICAFVPKGQEFILAEMSPGESTAVRTWVYVTRNCPTSTSSFQIEIRDTWRTPNGPQRLIVTLNPVSTGAYRVLANNLDADDPGSSDGTQKRMLVPAHHFELSAGLKVASRFSSAAMNFGISAADTGFFKAASFRKVNMHVIGKGRFGPGDDIDLEIVNSSNYSSFFASRAQDSRWINTDGEEQSIIWVVVDSVLGWEAKAGTAAAAGNRAAGNGGATPGGQQAGNPGKVPLSTVLKWVQDSVDLVPRPASTKTPGGIEATDGYEIQFDKSGFAEAYRGWGSAAGAVRGGGKKANASPSVKATGPTVLPYRYRSFIPVPIQTPQLVTGCTDGGAQNYNSAATKDDGSCTYRTGCMDNTAKNYDPAAQRSDNSCRYIEGCTDKKAQNYDPSATRSNNNRCSYVKGCMDRTALNYNRAAVKSDGSCKFPPPYVRFDGGVRFLIFPGETLTILPQFWETTAPLSLNGKLRASFGNQWRGMASLEAGTFTGGNFASNLLNGGRFALEFGGGRAVRLMNGKLEIEVLSKVGFNRVSFGGQMEQGQPDSGINSFAQESLLHFGLEPRLVFHFNPHLGAFAGLSWESGTTANVSTDGRGSLIVIDSTARTGIEFGLSYFY